MNIATRKKLNPNPGNPKMLPDFSESKITPTPWLFCVMARNTANTTMPRISKKTPVLFTIATIFTPYTFRIVISASVIRAATAWSG